MAINNVDNISDVPHAPKREVALTNVAEVVFKEDVLYFPIESTVDLAIEAEQALVHKEVREKAYRLYLDGSSPAIICKKLDMPLSIVTFWIKDGTWAQRMRDRNDIVEDAVRENIRQLRLSRAEEESRESLDIGKKLRERVKNKLNNDNEDLKPYDLKSLADAAKATGELGAHGMGESSPANKKEDESKGSTPLVIMINGGGLPEIRRVTVDEEGKEIK